MNKERIAQIASELERRLSVFFSDKSFTVACGKHWADRSKKPEQVAEDSIHTKIREAEKPDFGESKVINLFYDISSKQPSFVFADFNFSGKGEAGKNHSISLMLLDAFKVRGFINRGVTFYPEPYVWFVVKSDDHWWHIHLYPKFGHL